MDGWDNMDLRVGRGIENLTDCKVLYTSPHCNMVLKSKKWSEVFAFQLVFVIWCYWFPDGMYDQRDSRREGGCPPLEYWRYLTYWNLHSLILGQGTGFVEKYEINPITLWARTNWVGGKKVEIRNTKNSRVINYSQLRHFELAPLVDTNLQRRVNFCDWMRSSNLWNQNTSKDGKYSKTGKICSLIKWVIACNNKLAKLGDAIAISKSSNLSMTDWLTHWLTRVGARRCYRI